jgi:signal transduction histidine kinase
MKIFKSIKWRLQIWYGLILVAVLVGFGFTAYRLEWGRQMRRVDDELHRRIGILAIALLPPPPRSPNPGERPFVRPPPDQLPKDGPPLQNRPLPEFHLAPEDAHLFDTNDPNNFYYEIVSLRPGKDRGGLIARTANFPSPPYNISITVESLGATDVSTQCPARVFTQFPVNLTMSPPPHTFGSYRQIEHLLPSGELIYIGCSVSPELKELRLTALKLAGFGGIILILGLAGGWWISSRAIRPIEDISATALKISAGNLSQRINVAEAESELGQLASVLNSTFARLEAAFAQQQQFTSDAAHELRTPVSVMLTQTQTALNRERSAAEYRETLEACQRAAQRMRRLTESLLELARLDAGQEQMKRMKFDLSQIARNCVELIRPMADERNIKIHCELSPIECVGDSERIAQVITNLLTNAIQYNQEGGEVRLMAQSQKGMAMLAVSNTGRGISAEDLPHLFERFYRADQSRTSGNTGLGLAISKAIVEAHGGTIEVASRPDAGTTFTVRLPLT